MTRLPTESRDYLGLNLEYGDQYADYKVGPTCSVPGCARLADHAHHIVRRSELGGPFAWVRMPDGVEVGNLTGLCFNHHNEVTENKTQIRYVDGVFYWVVPLGEPTGDNFLLTQEVDAHPLVPQPPTPGEEPGGFPLAPAVEAPEDTRPVCPGCGRKMPKPKIDSAREEKKPRGTWAIAIPMDERENGADVLDEMLEGIRDKLDATGMSYSEDSNAKYYILATGMGLLLQHFDHVVADE